MSASNNHFDAVIIGGAIMGSSVAYYLKHCNPAMTVAVIEPDPTYEFASTTRASGGARRLFSCPENIAMSNFSIDFIKRFPQDMAIDGAPAHIDWVEQGYLFIVEGAYMRVLEQNARIQRAMGAEIHLLDRNGLRDRFPSMHVDDLDGGAYSPGDGWCDPSGFLQGMRKKSRSLGVEYIQDTVTGLDRRSGSSVAGASRAVTHAVLKSGRRIGGDVFVNAAGAWSAGISAMIDMPLPIQPMRRFEHYFTGHRKIEALPYVKDLNRLAFRPEGQGYSGGLVDSSAVRGFNFEIDHDYFERTVWPALAHRFPTAFDGVKCHRTWSGLYEQCELDGNPIIGNWQGHYDNFYVIAGFSGHGMMHAPAAGRALAELICRGRFDSIDLSNFSYRRVENNAPYRERGIL
jgi:FAD-dependent oxidoreductase domain-containing protein 1